MKRVFVIHGWNSHPNAAWKPWLKAQLEKKEFSVIAPGMPDPINPKCGEWIDKIKETVGKPDSHTYFVGHSLGCVAILRYLETIDVQTGGAVLVAGPSDNMNISFIKSFFEKEFDFDKIKQNCKRFVIIHSDNDKMVPVKHAYVLEKQLNAKLILEHKGHFVGIDGVKELPVVMEALLAID